ncbi:hypothetical protein CDN99_15110 [Roseateles aquatilis]|uniref:Ice-binding protein C-terminal domain-containing protein n=1 Tax=Roseateles aquatilis TaxID=431061 RepID=A0A246J839_9BURK|nr:PEP-CTERM sorting domain-containing protein [Roseateles aquatilis]OWQ88807.1 hypothetical protein CDN99_15110 [Roseateles aquatilis]
MKRVSSPALLALTLVGALAATPALAAPTVIDFDGPTSFAPIGDYYNGGAGPNLGVSFTEPALGLANDALGTYFTNAPSMGGVMFTFDTGAFMNVAKGFTGEVSFFYSAAAAFADAVTIYSGLNGTGSVLGTFSLTDNATLGCSDSGFCHWDRLSLAFNGTAQSIGFGAGAGQLAFDDVSISAVPEPESFALMLAGLAAMGVVTRRQRRG